MKIIWNFKILSREFDIALRSQKERTREMLGITNLTKDGKWIVFMDFDGFKQEWLDVIVPELQKLYRLSDAYLFQSSEHGFHLITFDKLGIKALVEILKSASCDPNYIFVPLKYGLKLWTLRQNEKKGEKPKFIKIYPKNPNIIYRYQRSLAHMIAFEKLYNMSIDKAYNDGIEDFVIVSGYEIA
jgi:hypothetical protein